MRIERLAVGGYGVLPSGLRLEPGPGLNLVLAPNEAGKTTLLDLITALFYGFGARKAGTYAAQPWQGGELGGELAYVLADGRAFDLSRHVLGRRENLILRDAQGNELALKGQSPGELHLGLSRGVFLTVSRLGLDDLQGAFSGGSPSERKDAREQLLGLFFLEAATRGEVANPVAVVEGWRAAAQGLHSRDRRSGRADRELEARLAEAAQAQAQAREEEDRARDMRARLAELGGQRQGLRERFQAAQAAGEAARQALQRARDQARRAELAGQVAQLVAQGLCDQATAQRARDLTNQARQAAQASEAAARQAAELQALAQKLASGADPATAERQLERLAREWATLEELAQEQAGRGKELEAKGQELRAAWGLEPEALAALEEDLPFRLQRLKEGLKKAQAEERQARQKQAALPRPAVWAPWLGLVLGGVSLSAGVLLVLRGLAGQQEWALLVGGLLLVAAAGLWIKSLRDRARLSAPPVEPEQAVLARVAQMELNELAARLGRDPDQIDPSRLAQDRARALELISQRQARQARRDQLQERRQRLQTEMAPWLGPEDTDPATALAQAGERLAQARQLSAQAQAQSQRAAELNRQAQSAQEELAALLASAGLADLAALDQARARAQRVGELNSQLAEVDRRLGGDPAPGPGLPQAQAELERVLAQERELRQELAELDQETGRLEQGLAELAARPGLAQAQARHQDLQAQRRELARRQATYLAASVLLEQAMEAFRLEAQPSLLRRAGQYLAQATAGTYEWLGSDLFAPQGSKEPLLSARQGPGASERPAQDLSRGTRDQLYLCLRLALADEITGAGEPLPLLLDDPLVNFDHQRLEASLAMIGQLAQTRQVLLVTCHPHQVEMLASAPGARVLELPG